MVRASHRGLAHGSSPEEFAAAMAKCQHGDPSFCSSAGRCYYGWCFSPMQYECPTCHSWNRSRCPVCKGKGRTTRANLERWAKLLPEHQP